MTKSFLNRVEAERRVLAIVNRHTYGQSQLAGLSNFAIEDWQRRAVNRDLREVVINLRTLADACQCLSDRSHETFRPLDPRLEGRIDVGITALEHALSTVFGSKAEAN